MIIMFQLAISFLGIIFGVFEVIFGIVMNVLAFILGIVGMIFSGISKCFKKNS